jgi:hypothetical protein
MFHAEVTICSHKVGLMKYMDGVEVMKGNLELDI